MQRAGYGGASGSGGGRLVRERGQSEQALGQRSRSCWPVVLRAGTTGLFARFFFSASSPNSQYPKENYPKKDTKERKKKHPKKYPNSREQLTKGLGHLQR